MLRIKVNVYGLVDAHNRLILGVKLENKELKFITLRKAIN